MRSAPPTSESVSILFLSILLYNRATESRGREKLPSFSWRQSISKDKERQHSPAHHSLNLLATVSIIESQRESESVPERVQSVRTEKERLANVSFCLVKPVIYFSLCVATGCKYICNYPHSRQVGLMEKPLADGGETGKESCKRWRRTQLWL